MATGGTTTKIELLRSGNFPTWRAQVDVLLHQHGLKEAANSSVSRWSVAELLTKGMSECRMASVLIRGLVSPALLKYLSLKDVDDPASLLRELERISGPFRFMDLPPELRERIYRAVVPADTTILVKPHAKKSQPFPAITRVSQLIRKEVLPIFYASVTFKFDFTGSRTPDRSVVSGIDRWVAQMGANSMKDLSTVTLSMTFPNARWVTQHVIREIEFSFSRRHGLQVKSGLSYGVSDDLLRRHVQVVESSRNTLGLRGESIILALTIHPRLWSPATLEAWIGT
jgi:hypothetical protein